MYNLTLPSALKAWLDQVALLGRNVATETSLTKGKPAHVVASRGIPYAGAPNEGYEYVQNHLQAVLGDMLDMEVDFIVPELTLAQVTHRVPIAHQRAAPRADRGGSPAGERCVRSRRFPGTER